jgi:nicotinamide phosphoribosyltransferase
MLWKPCTSATTARFYRKLLEEYAEETGSPLAFVPWQAHDFSFRGMGGLQDSALSGAGHLLSFTGTDTVPAIDLLEDYYGANAEKELVGGSVPATEHSVMCMGSKECEIDTFRRLLLEIYPTGIVSVVSDTWDFWKVVTEHVKTLHQEIMSRDGKLVIRPDSGDPVKIICGDASEPNGSPAHKGAIECLWEVFGGTVTEKGYKMLDPHIGLIYGDSITPDRAWKIMEGLKQKGFASGNVVFGVGSYTYQYVTRDTYGFAVKSTYGEINGNPCDIFKDPVTDSGIKKSARGRLKVLRLNGNLTLLDGQYGLEGGELVPVFRDGKLLVEQTLAEIRARVAA